MAPCAILTPLAGPIKRPTPGQRPFPHKTTGNEKILQPRRRTTELLKKLFYRVSTFVKG